jgi:hypothetical protein
MQEKESAVTAETLSENNKFNETFTELMEQVKDHLTKRPSGEYLPEDFWRELMCIINILKEVFGDHMVHLRPNDRRRLNGVGIRGQGFVHRCYDSAVENEQLLPRTLELQQFFDNEQDFNRKRMLYEALSEFQKEAWNATLTAADVVYGDALEYYNSVREAAKRRVPGAEDAYNFLKPFFARRTRQAAEPTHKEMMRDFKAVLDGKKDGTVEVKNESPKVTGGKREAVDETHRAKIAYKDTDSGEITE